jgi:hypothetical protein
MNWAPVQQTYFLSKIPNACRKRHERVIERRNTENWDGLKLEILAKNYVGMRREIWSGLAAQVGEKWNVVEQKVPSSINQTYTETNFTKCMLQGLKNLQLAARSCARRERMLDTSQGDELEADYDGDRAHDRSGNASAYQGHYYSSSGGSGVSGGNHPHVQRLPSMDMGIDAIINRPRNGR